MVDQETFHKVIEQLDKNDQHLAEVIDNHAKAITELVRHKTTEEQKQALKSYLDHLTKTSAHLFESASKYSNLVSVAGYAAFFAIWNGTKEYVNSEIVHLASAFLIGISASFFVFFETYKMIKAQTLVQTYKSYIKEIRTLYAAQKYQEGIATLESLKLDEAKFQLSMTTSSRLCQIAAICTGLLGVALLVGILGHSILVRLVALSQG